jgi:L-malate glycosyltransferase
MKVCFIVGTLGRGGAERQLMYMLRVLKSNGIAARVLCLTKDESYEDEIRSNGIDVEWIGSHANRGLRLLSIVNNLRKTRADVVQSSHFYTNIYAGLAGKILNVPSIGAVRSDLISEIRLHGLLGNWQVSLPNFLIVNSELAYRRAVEFGRSPEKIEVVPNVVESSTNGSKKLLNCVSKIKLLFVGRLDEDKRPEKFISLAAKLTKTFPEISMQFQIAGDGELRTKLENMAQGLNLLPDKLEFLGLCAEMKAVYSQADILISTSVREGTSNVILEAMGHGLPVIATNSGGTPDILTQERGILVEPDNEMDLTTAATKLILDKEIRGKLGSNGQDYVKKNHSIERLQTQLSGIYEKLV